MRSDYPGARAAASGDRVLSGGGRAPADERLARLVALLLRGGVLLATVITAAGGVTFLSRHGGDTPRFNVFQGVPVTLSDVPRTVRALGGDPADALMLAGVLVLIATPVTRVVISFLDFLRERNWIYVGFTALVLAALAISVIQAY